MALIEKALLALKPKDQNYPVADAAGLVVEVTKTSYLPIDLPARELD
jgi:hypothetical protein